MFSLKQKLIIGGLSGLSLAILIFLGLWLWVLGSGEPLKNPLAAYFPWPVMCTTRGCLTTATWRQQDALAQSFAKTVGQTAPAPETALTTATRRQLLHYALIRSPVTATDARRYREEVLHIKNEATLTDSFHMTADEYDRLVLIPFLQQEALRQERSLESADELYKQLSEERAVFILPFDLKWDKGTGSVVTD